MTAFDKAVVDARDTLIEQAEYAKEFLTGMSRERLEDWLHEETHEAVDGAGPIYNDDIMACAADYRVWSQDTTDLGSPRDLTQAAQWAIYQAIEEALYEDASLLDAIEGIAETDEEILQ